MTTEPVLLIGAALVYLVILFFVAHATDRGRIPASWVSHPLTYALSLGVYATSWSYYGSVGFAASNGYQFLTIYLGVTVAFVLGPVLLKPILRLAHEYQLGSLADLFAFRYRSQLAGVLVTLFMLVGTLPYIALQIRAVTESLRVVTDETPPHVLALGFCVVLTLFAVLFGARHVSPREKHRGLVAAIAFESLVKLVALLCVGLFALFGVFGGGDGLHQWMTDNPQAVTALYEPVRSGPWQTLLFLAFAAAFLLPRQFHMAFAENLREDGLRTASWAFPLFLLLINLPIPIVLWAGQQQGLTIDPDYYVMGLALSDAAPGWLPVLAFVGGVSAASAMVIVTTLALASMSLNHLLLPASYPDINLNIYRWLLWGRRLLIALIIAAGYGFYTLLEHKQSLVQLGLISFVAVAQFLPGIAGLLYWRRATRAGFIAGLLGGIGVWTLTLLLPILDSSGIVAGDYHISALREQSGLDRWTFATFWSLALNTLLFVGVSLATRQSAGEQTAARSCCTQGFQPLSGVVSARSPEAFRIELAEIIGSEAADKEVRQALWDLDMAPDERRPSELRRLRERIERNLSGLLGPQMAHMIVNSRLELDAEAKTALADSVRYVEDRLEASRSQLDGLYAELDKLQRYHRQILLELPLGVCAVTHDNQVVVWNLAMEVQSGISGTQARGSLLAELPEPWDQVLTGFTRASDEHIHHLEVPMHGRRHWFNLHKARIIEPGPGLQPGGPPGLVILVEDLTDIENLEAELAHSDRLASIGRLAAGVAHEIGNPVTGIASLAQNLRHETDEAVIRQSIDDILVQTRRITAIIRSLMNFSRSGEERHVSEAVRLCDVLEDALRLVNLTHKHKAIQFDADCAPGLTVEGDRQRLSQVFVNLLTNAGDASPRGGQVTINGEPNEGNAVIHVTDQGDGVPDDLKTAIFEPFVTTKASGEGTGLGLALAQKIVLDHGGDIALQSAPGTGTRVTVTLPLTTASKSKVA
jgi:PAS domain S-box-containing protein